MCKRHFRKKLFQNWVLSFSYISECHIPNRGPQLYIHLYKRRYLTCWTLHTFQESLSHQLSLQEKLLQWTRLLQHVNTLACTVLILSNEEKMLLLWHVFICFCKHTLISLEKIGVIVKWENMTVWKYFYQCTTQKWLKLAERCQINLSAIWQDHIWHYEKLKVLK